MNTKPNPPVIFAKFTEDNILDEMGRLLYAILNVFATNGYQVILYDNINFSELDKYGQLVPSMNNLTLVNTVPECSSHMFYLFDREDKSCSDHQWKRKIQIKFDTFSTYRITEPVFMPYPVHPLLAGADLPQRLEIFRKNEKRLRIFFSGDTKGYTNNRIHYPNTKLPRLEVINTILDELGDRTIHVEDDAALKELFAGDFNNSCVIVDTGKMWVDPADWLPRLSKTDFFICPPGYSMPMCHNVIEAMAVGSVPIINYPEWFNPPLRHMENCVSFYDRKDLIKKIRSIFELEQQKISEMRNQAIDYYEKHLSPRKFISNIESKQESKTTVLMITDKNTIKNARRLNKNSILIRGKPTLANSRWYKLLQSFKA
jgi:hypothetical protein